MQTTFTNRRAPRTHAPRGSSRNERGLTLVEVLTAAVILSMVLIGASYSLNGSARARVALADEGSEAAFVAREIHELAQSLAREPSGSGPVTTGAGVLALDSLDGAVFNPPLRGDGSADASRSDFTQQVDVVVVSLSDPSVPTGQSASMGVDPFDPVLFRVDVTVLQGGTDVGSWSWWLTP